jgi:hypothetical protein
MQIESCPRLRWNEMKPAQKGGAIILGMLQFSLLAAALWDLRHRPAAEVNGDKRLWTAFAFVNFIGPITYFVFGRKKNDAHDPISSSM